MVNCVLERRLGQVKVDRTVLESMSDDDLQNLFSLFGIVIMAEVDFSSLKHRFIISRPDLPIISQNEIIPEYEIIIEKTGDCKTMRISPLDIYLKPISEEEDAACD